MAISQVRETLADLLRSKEKAELIGGRVVPLMPTGSWPSEVAGNIFAQLMAHCRITKRGKAFADNTGYTVAELSSGRESFSPDVSCFGGSLPSKSMKFIDGPPTFAVEVRSQEDAGSSAEAEMAAKRADYFEAGTRIVWDVDPRSETVFVYRSASEEPVQTFQRGDIATAEPAVLGWSMSVDDIFREQN